MHRRVRGSSLVQVPSRLLPHSSKVRMRSLEATIRRPNGKVSPPRGLTPIPITQSPDRSRLSLAPDSSHRGNSSVSATSSWTPSPASGIATSGVSACGAASVSVDVSSPPVA